MLIEAAIRLPWAWGLDENRYSVLIDPVGDEDSVDALKSGLHERTCVEEEAYRPVTRIVAQARGFPAEWGCDSDSWR